MANTSSSIEWTDATWNPVTGCDRVSSGCDNCYALDLAARLKAMGNVRYQNDGNPKTSGPGFGVTMHPDVLEMPLRWQKPRLVFVNSMSDLWHSDVPTEFIAETFAVFALAPRHTFQVLTKRPQRMRRLLNDSEFWWAVLTAVARRRAEMGLPLVRDEPPFPLPNVWLGVSVENQEAAYRIDWLVRTPAAVRFLSIEPMIGPVDLSLWLAVPCPSCGVIHLGYCEAPDPPLLHWAITGGESGPKSRPFDPAWAVAVRDQCQAAGVAFFHKQNGGRTPKAGGRLLDGREWSEFPEIAAGQAVAS